MVVEKNNEVDKDKTASAPKKKYIRKTTNSKVPAEAKQEDKTNQPIQPNLLKPETTHSSVNNQSENKNSDTGVQLKEDRNQNRQYSKKPRRNGNGNGNSDNNKRYKDEYQYRDKTAPSLDLSELQAKSMHDLAEMGNSLNIEGIGALDKPDLIFEILKANAEKSGLMYGSGYLEILPDGFGFLRSANYCYLPCPEDIYLSPSQIRRFSLKTGDLLPVKLGSPGKKNVFLQC